MNMVGKVDEPSTRSPEERSLVAWPAPPQLKDSTAARQQTICHWRKAPARRSSALTGHTAEGTHWGCRSVFGTRFSGRPWFKKEKDSDS
ncbi:hypothetical protein N7497_012155 [Penicillium chrysogenum]|nr:hypothetical protein N7497_012155 [Penicillium chrysogenum]